MNKSKASFQMIELFSQAQGKEGTRDKSCNSAVPQLLKNFTNGKHSELQLQFKVTNSLQ